METPTTYQVHHLDIEPTEIWRKINLVCGLFDMARDLKIMELRRRHPGQPEAWLEQEALSLIEKGCR